MTTPGTWTYTVLKTTHGALITNGGKGFVFAGRPGGGTWRYVCQAERRQRDGQGWIVCDGWGDTPEEAEANARRQAASMDTEGRW